MLSFKNDQDSLGIGLKNRQAKVRQSVNNTIDSRYLLDDGQSSTDENYGIKKQKRAGVSFALEEPKSAQNPRSRESLPELAPSKMSRNSSVKSIDRQTKVEKE